MPDMPDPRRNELPGAPFFQEVDMADGPAAVGADLVYGDLQRLLDGRRLVRSYGDPLQELDLPLSFVEVADASFRNQLGLAAGLALALESLRQALDVGAFWIAHAAASVSEFAAGTKSETRISDHRDACRSVARWLPPTHSVPPLLGSGPRRIRTACAASYTPEREPPPPKNQNRRPAHPPQGRSYEPRGG